MNYTQLKHKIYKQIIRACATKSTDPKYKYILYRDSHTIVNLQKCDLIYIKQIANQQLTKHTVKQYIDTYTHLQLVTVNRIPLTLQQVIKSIDSNSMFGLDALMRQQLADYLHMDIVSIYYSTFLDFMRGKLSFNEIKTANNLPF